MTDAQWAAIEAAAVGTLVTGLAAAAQAYLTGVVDLRACIAIGVLAMAAKWTPKQVIGTSGKS